MKHLKTIKTIEVIHIGDELLMGLRVNSHLEYLARRFTQYGAVLIRDQVVRDIRQEIQWSLEQASSEAELIVITGGLGPTVDDITRDAVAEFLGMKLIYNENVEAWIRERFASFGREVTQNNLQQCYHPEGSELLENANGTAPGIWIETDQRLIVMLPGPPRELIPMVEDQVIPRLLREDRLEPESGYIQLRTCGVGESALASKIDSWLEDEKEISTAYCVHSGVVDVRLSSPKGNLDHVAEVAAEMVKKLGDDFVGYGERSLAEIVLEKLQARNESIAFAESCTGGQLASAITAIPGASSSFKGSVVPYQNAMKTEFLGVPSNLIDEHHEVSSAVAEAMAKACGAI
jgi:nicotinamide-nucleotide amidase